METVHLHAIRSSQPLFWICANWQLCIESFHTEQWVSGVDGLAQVHKYIKDNEEEMRYDVFRGKGYDIGSGAVEGCCKHVVGKRLKQSGMIWARTGSSATLALRITWLNQQWDRLWSRKPLAA